VRRVGSVGRIGGEGRSAESFEARISIANLMSHASQVVEAWINFECLFKNNVGALELIK
jgi:hypothetical protein